ncbi:MAG TPA: penicillin acylase family protein, partial [Solirubrobacterales bacterium]|nr:penicillin acylase family protein [Solirubrobacterales bacterium]
RAAEQEVERLDPDLREQIERYCAGVNAGVGLARARPLEYRIARIEPEPYTVADVLTIGKLLAFGLSTNWEKELLRADLARHLGPELAARLDPVYPAGNPIVSQAAWNGDGARAAAQIDRVRKEIGLAPEAGGSNNWAVSGERSVTGKPLIAGDPHLPPSMPGIWYEAALYRGERFARGATMAGLPGIYMGQNTDVCWTFTNVMADVQDLFIERIEGEHYLYEDEWLPLRTAWEEIRVRGRDEPEQLAVRSTHHGPIVNACIGADEAEPLALRWISLDEPTTHRAMTGILDVGSGAELLELMSHHTSPASNMIWADRHGSIGYKLTGSLPRRKGDCPDLPKPGWTGEFEWDGKIPYAELPELTDPESGYLITANNRIVGDEYPHHITSEWLDGARALRIEELLRGRERHDLEGFAEMQMDKHSEPGLEVARRLVALGGRNQPERAAVERLRSWDGDLDAETVAGTVYQAFVIRLGRDFVRAVVGDRDLAERWLDRSDSAFTSHVSSPWRWQSHLMELWDEGDSELIGRPWDDLALDALRGALEDLREIFGDDPAGWRWGRVHRLEFPHPLGAANPLLRRLFNRRLEVGGAQETICQVAYDPGDPYRAVWAPSWRMVADPADPGRSRWQMFTGQSGHVASPHYDDLQPRWQAGETQAMAGDGPWQELRLEPAGSTV